jgi:hypothetical protein
MTGRTACGFCERGIYKGRRCPYCDGTGDAPQGFLAHHSDHTDGCFICPKCGQHVRFSRAEMHPCKVDRTNKRGPA